MTTNCLASATSCNSTNYPIIECSDDFYVSTICRAESVAINTPSETSEAGNAYQFVIYSNSSTPSLKVPKFTTNTTGCNVIRYQIVNQANATD